MIPADAIAWVRLVVCLAGMLALPSGGPVGASVQPDLDYVLGAHDVLQISVFNQEELSGLYTIGADGSFSFPLIGRIAADGLTVRAFEQALRDGLADGYFRDPQVIVSVAEYRSRQVFVVGEVRQPGAYPLTGEMNLIGLLATAGSTTASASSIAIVVRAGPSTAPVLPDANDNAEVIRVDLGELQRGVLAHNVRLRDGDTVFVPRAETVYVFGEVRSPGQYPIETATTVLQALSMAGGSTEFGALNRVRVSRIVDGEQREFRVELDDVVQAGDTIIVPQRFF